MSDTTTTTTTTDIATIEKKALDRLNKSLAKSGLDDLLQSARRSLLLVDTSVSMTRPLKTGQRRIDALRAVVDGLREGGPVPVAAFGLFYTPDGTRTVQVVTDIPEPQGGTPLHDAIAFGTREGATHLVIVTDGEPDDADAAFAAAREFGNAIDVFYIGDGNDGGARFCAALAKLTGGTCGVTDLLQPKQLTGSIRLLLGDGTN